MATLASNITGAVGKWNPYYFKPFMLGRQGDGSGSTDGHTYISQTAGDSGVSLEGSCTDSYNCGFYYILEWLAVSTSRYFWVLKYDLNDNLIDTIYASGNTSNSRFWSASATKTITIDIGVNISFSTVSGFETGDKYKITLPSLSKMNKMKLYHGGYSSFLRMPETEGKAYHSDIIPTNLKGKNITVVFNAPMGFHTIAEASQGLSVAFSRADELGNAAVSLELEWNVDKDSATSDGAGNTSYQWDSEETWQLGTIFANDVDPFTTGADFPLAGQAPASDLQPAVNVTGDVQAINVTTSGRAGHAKIRTEYMTGDGSPKINAFNQFWPVILLIS